MIFNAAWSCGNKVYSLCDPRSRRSLLCCYMIHNREVADSCRADIFIRDMACFHCKSMNCTSNSSVNHNEINRIRYENLAVRECTTSLLCGMLQFTLRVICTNNVDWYNPQDSNMVMTSMGRGGGEGFTCSQSFTAQGFFFKFLMVGGNSIFFCPLRSPSGMKSNGGTYKKFPSEAKVPPLS